MPDGSQNERSGSGFQGQIKGASLADLVQMECLGRVQRIVRVTAGTDQGYIYFRGGALVHATTGALSGEAAALEVLGWRAGTYEPVERDWPVTETVHCTWQSLLLRAAQIEDESRGGNVVALRPDGRTRIEGEPSPVADSMEFEVTPIEVGRHLMRREDFALVLRMSPGGTTLVNQGGTQDFADMAAYAARLSELIGMLLGVDRFTAMECTLKGGPCFIVLEEDGAIVALRPRPNVDLASMRELLGL